MPAGWYVLQADMRNTDGADRLTDQHIYAQAGGAEVQNSAVLDKVSGDNNNDWTRMRIEDIQLSDGETLRLGAASTGDGTSTKGWFQADNFRLYYYGNTAVSVIETGSSAEGVTIEIVDGGLKVTSGSSMNLPVYGIDGTLVDNVRLSAGTNTVKLPHGQYVVGGKVCLIK